MEIVNPFSVCNVPGYRPFSPMKWGMLEGSTSSGSLCVLYLYLTTCLPDGQDWGLMSS